MSFSRNELNRYNYRSAHERFFWEVKTTKSCLYIIGSFSLNGYLELRHLAFFNFFWLF